MTIVPRVIVLLAGALWVGAASAQGAAPPPAVTDTAAKPLSTSLALVVFPAKGQAPSKQAADEGECFAWSKGQTGVDPFAAPPAPPAATPAPASTADGSRARGALRGAAAGAVIGEVVDNDAGGGAAVGATAGVLKGGAQARRSRAEAQKQSAGQSQQQAQQQQAAQAEQRALFNKGFAACLEARGYTVK